MKRVMLPAIVLSWTLLFAGVAAAQSAAPEAWTPWSPREELMPVTRYEDGRWTVKASEVASCHGGWDLAWAKFTPGAWYRVEVVGEPTGLSRIHDTAHVELLWWGTGKKRPLDWAHVRFEPAREGEYLYRTERQAPENATRVTLRLMLRWTNRGSIVWRNVRFRKIEPPAPRKIAVAVATGEFPGTSVKDNLEFALKLVDQAADAGAKVVCLPECITTWRVDGREEDGARPIPGAESDALCRKARERKTDIVCSMNERSGNLIYNTGLYIDAGKGIVGKYRKVHLAVGERWRGITPGAEFPVWQTGYGKAGMLICYDNVMPQGHQILAQKGAEVIFLPIMGDPRAVGEKAFERWRQIMRVRAIDNHVWLVVSRNRGEWGCVVRPDGEIVAEMSPTNGIAVAEIDLNFRYRSWIGSDFGNRYWGERRPHVYGELGEDR